MFEASGILFGGVIMEVFLKINRILIKFKRSLKENSLEEISFDYALILYCMANSKSKASCFSRLLSKDTSYVLRVLKKMIQEDLILQDGREYRMTPKGQKVFDEISLFSEEVMESFDSNETEEISHTLDTLELTLD